jgi:Uma2 family endonuclease
MTTARRLHHTYADYLSVERDSPVRHECLDGEIFAMAGGTPEQAALAAQLTALLQTRLPAGCRAFSSNLKVRTEASGLTTYPDLSVVCGPVARSLDDPDAITNPVILVEVTSPSSEEYDRGEKLLHYRQIPSLQAVLTVSHREPRITSFERTAGGWRQGDLGTGLEVGLASPPVTFAVDEVYRALVGL